MASFSLLSLNTFGVPFYLSLTRIKRLAAELSRLAPTVICLQEVQQNAYLPILQRALAEYPHAAFYRNRFAPKGGLFTASVSDCPLVSSLFYPFPNRGKWLSVGFADRALNKGVLVVELEVQDRRVIVMNTHLQANYAGNWLPENPQALIQMDQVKALAELAHSQPDDALVFLCGDFNFPRHTPVYDWFVEHSGMIDSLAEDPRPTYQPFPLVPSRWKIALDYFFYRTPPEGGWNVAADIIPIVNTSARQPIRRFLTDHNALLLKIN
jgi:endonuclease/exonuclease/phosphatase family metal-dependent hydrolase